MFFLCRTTKMKKLNPPRLVVLFIVIVFASLILYGSLHSSSPWNGPSFIRKDQSDEDNPRLIEVLRKVSNPDRTVIVTAVDEAWARPGSILDLFLESFRIGVGTKQLLNHVLIAATDDRAFRHCKAKHRHCFRLPTSNITNAGKPSTHRHPQLSKLDWRVMGLLGDISDLGYNLIFTEADVMWLRYPLANIDPFLELTFATEVYRGEATSTNKKEDPSFFFAKSFDNVVEILRFWEVAMVLRPENDASSIMEMTRDGQFLNYRLSTRIKYLDAAYYSGFCQQYQDMRQVLTVRANCCEDLESKVHDLRLLLDEWRNFIAGSSTPSSSGIRRKCGQRGSNPLSQKNSTTTHELKSIR